MFNQCMMSTMDVNEDEFVFDEELILCIKQRHNKEAKEIFENENYSVSLIDSLGNNMLHYSAQYSNDEMVKYFINLGSEINAQNHQGKTPLLLAIELHNFYDWDVYNWQSIVNLFNAKANMHIRDKRGRSPLQNILAKKNSNKLVSLALEKLKEECSGNSEQIARKLMEAHCSIYDALHLKNAEVTRILLANNCVLNPPYAIDAETVFAASIQMNYLENVRALLDHGADPNAESQYQGTPLMAYSRIYKKTGENENPEILQLLLDRGANPTMILTRSDDRGKMQICGVFSSCNAESIRVLLRYNIDLDARDDHGRSAIHYVVENRRPNVFDVLDGKNFNTNARDLSGYPPILYLLQLYCGKPTPEVVKFLLDNGADVNAASPRGIGTFLMRTVIRSLIAARSSRKFSIELERDEQIIEYLLYRGADPQVVTAIGHSVFNNAILFDGEYKGKRTLIAQLALIEARGTPIKQIIFDQIDAKAEDREALTLYRRELQKMMKIKIWKSLTLHELLVGGEDKLRRYLGDDDFILRLNRLSYKYMSISYYRYTMGENISKIYFLFRLRKKSIETMCTVTGIRFESFYYIIEKILSYLTEKDLLNFCQIT